MEENKNTYSKVVNGHGDYFYTGLYKRVLEMAELKGINKPSQTETAY